MTFVIVEPGAVALNTYAVMAVEWFAHWSSVSVVAMETNWFHMRMLSAWSDRDNYLDYVRLIHSNYHCWPSVTNLDAHTDWLS